MSELPPAGATVAGQTTVPTTYSGRVKTTGEADRQASEHSVSQPGRLAPDPEIERYRQMLAALEGCAVFVITSDGHVQTWPEPAIRLFGYAPAEIAGHHISCLFSPADIEGGLPQRWLEAARQSGSAQDDGWRVRSDGSQLWAASSMTAMAGAFGAVSGFVVASRDITVQFAAEEHARLADDLAGRIPAWRGRLRGERRWRDPQLELGRAGDYRLPA
ncbi:PAS domain-containing protein [Cupriavidus sp. CuC1]|uniref:PAS domain-containing protein n=1 Tax=Cupriavidus sp. CuC1 TaxID=3373131 RepID=UPI0037D85D6A